jgi:hypothetical protein
MPPAEEFSVLAHELAHEMLHHRKDEARLPKVVVETQAEAVAYVVPRGVGSKPTPLQLITLRSTTATRKPSPNHFP